jgi:hypothetical protein
MADPVNIPNVGVVSVGEVADKPTLTLVRRDGTVESLTATGDGVFYSRADRNESIPLEVAMMGDATSSRELEDVIRNFSRDTALSAADRVLEYSANYDLAELARTEQEIATRRERATAIGEARDTLGTLTAPNPNQAQPNNSTQSPVLP